MLIVKIQYKDEKKLYVNIYIVFILICGRGDIKKIQFTAPKRECGLCSSSISILGKFLAVQIPRIKTFQIRNSKDRVLKSTTTHTHMILL